MARLHSVCPANFSTQEKQLIIIRLYYNYFLHLHGAIGTLHLKSHGWLLSLVYYFSKGNLAGNLYNKQKPASQF
jgi:hypothetical protein